MARLYAGFLLLSALVVGFTLACTSDEAPQTTAPIAVSTPEPTPVPTLAQAPTPKPSATPTPTPTLTTPTPTPTPTSTPTSTSTPTLTVPVTEAEAQETRQVVWAVSDDVIALVDVPENWDEDPELMAAYAGREDVDALFLRASTADGLPAMSIYRLARVMDDAEIETRVSEFMEPSDERKGQRTSEGEIGGVAVVIMSSVSISEPYGNERVARVFAPLENDHTWMIVCYAVEFDTQQHTDCGAALRSVRIAPESFVRNLTTPTPTVAEAAAKAELARKYTEAGEGLDEARSPDLTWSDGSNWRDGVSHQLPDLPLSLRVGVQEGMTCAQWEALEIAVFPEGESYNRSNWWGHPDSDEIRTLWREELARAVYGGDYGAMAREFIGAVFTDHCGSRMR